MTRDDDDDANDANEGDGRRFENDRPTDRLTARGGFDEHRNISYCHWRVKI